MNLTIDAHVATLRFDRPEQHNRIRPQDLDDLAWRLREIEENHDVWVLILASTGPVFSAGFDVGSIAVGAPQRFEEVADMLAGVRVPSIAAIQGPVHGGAGDLALACDFRIGVDAVTLVVPPVRLGIPYYPSGIERFIQRVGVNAAKRILLLGEKLHAEQLLRMGYLDEVVAADRLEGRARELAAALSEGAPLAVEAMKQQLRRFDREAGERAMGICLASEDHKEALAAFREKRRPDFQRR
jgi:enoyl-CoA hydratase